MDIVPNTPKRTLQHPNDDKLTKTGTTQDYYCCKMTLQPPIDDILTITGLNVGRLIYIDHNRACCRGGGIILTKIGIRSGGGHFIDQKRD